MLEVCLFTVIVHRCFSREREREREITRYILLGLKSLLTLALKTQAALPSMDMVRTESRSEHRSACFAITTHQRGSQNNSSDALHASMCASAPPTSSLHPTRRSQNQPNIKMFQSRSLLGMVKAMLLAADKSTACS